MFRFFTVLDKFLVRCLNAIIIFTNLAIMALILILVISRFMGWSVIGMLELATISALWLYMTGAIVAARNGEHLVVDFLTQQLGSKARAIHKIATTMCIFAISLFFIYLAMEMMEFATRRPQTTPALSLPLLIPQSAVVLAALSTTAYAFRDVINAIIEFSNNTDVEAS